jgi:hypothetical protein
MAVSTQNWSKSCAWPLAGKPTSSRYDSCCTNSETKWISTMEIDVIWDEIDDFGWRVWATDGWASWMPGCQRCRDRGGEGMERAPRPCTWYLYPVVPIFWVLLARLMVSTL